MIKSVEVTTDKGVMVKPRELIEIKGAGPLGLLDRRNFNILLDKAWGKELLHPHHQFTIDTSELRHGSANNQNMKASLRKLQQTLVVVTKSNGDQVTSQLLGSTRVKPSGDLDYSFPLELSGLLKDSSVFAKLDLELMRSFSSKYAFALYEQVSRRVGLSYQMTENLSMQGLRDLLGVEDGKLTRVFNLTKKALGPALTEVNAITPYQVTIISRKKGRKVIGWIMGWSIKDVAGMKQAYAELQRPKLGRRERLDGTSPSVVES